MSRFAVARRGAPPRRGLKGHTFDGKSDDHLVSLGEPFLVCADAAIAGVPLVRLFGPGRYWIARQPDGDVVGEGLDLWDNVVERICVLDERRNGMVRGKWFSRWCPDGEYGTRSYVELAPLTAAAYHEALARVRERRASAKI